MSQSRRPPRRRRPPALPTPRILVLLAHLRGRFREQPRVAQKRVAPPLQTRSRVRGRVSGGAAQLGSLMLGVAPSPVKSCAVHAELGEADADLFGARAAFDDGRRFGQAVLREML